MLNDLSSDVAPLLIPHEYSVGNKILTISHAKDNLPCAYSYLEIFVGRKQPNLNYCTRYRREESSTRLSVYRLLIYVIEPLRSPLIHVTRMIA